MSEKLAVFLKTCPSLGGSSNCCLGCLTGRTQSLRGTVLFDAFLGGANRMSSSSRSFVALLGSSSSSI